MWSAFPHWGMMFKHISVLLHAPRVTLGVAIPRKHLHDGLVKLHPKVSEAIAKKEAVLALESTIITHGMPYPHNLNTAKEVEQIVKEHGVVPATVGIVKGKIHVGLSDSDLQYLAENKKMLKASRRDLPYILTKGLSAGTTVSATMMIAHKVGIPLLVTGGIGGVHHDGQNTLDISTDLTELGRNPVTVISAGVKSILDIGRTLEYLETHGVCVATFGKSRDFPAFFLPKSGFQSAYNVTDEEEAAQLIVNAHKFGQDSSVLIAVPIPEEQAASGLVIDDAIQQAVQEARNKGIRGKDVTPFILDRVYELTKGISLTANIALIKNNAKVGSRIACALTRQSYHKYSTLSQPPREKLGAHEKLVVIGGCNVDFIAKAKQGNLMVSKFKVQLQSASLVCLDGNIPTSTINYVCSFAEEHGIPELPSVMDDVIGVALDMSRPLLKHLQCVIVTLGQHGVLLCGKSEEGTISLQPKKSPKDVPGTSCAIHYPAIAIEAEEILNVSGAGDSLAAGIIAGILTGQETHTCIRMGLLAARYSLGSQEAISTLINTDSVNPQKVIDRVWQQPTYQNENKPPTTKSEL
ncbi:pseudouridine-5'-phosphate glycosidase isoform X8 [Scyliorhinus torazame]|uniref:pseudouridine-5'-phosphate glycosidase isoform X8 n=1 Tax=Scyliorhinus torazame TaxID=75743 RepID=UPI003B5B962E